MIVVAFDVLAQAGDELGARKPVNEARKLWNMLFQQYHGRICVLATGVDKDKTPILLEWLKREGFKAGSVDITHERTADAKLDRIRAVQAGFGRVEWYVDIDPTTVTKAIHEGIPALLVSIPDIVRPEWVSGRDVRGWDELSQELEAQALARAERAWQDE